MVGESNVIFSLFWVIYSFLCEPAPPSLLGPKDPGPDEPQALRRRDDAHEGRGARARRGEVRSHVRGDVDVALEQREEREKTPDRLILCGTIT